MNFPRIFFILLTVFGLFLPIVSFAAEELPNIVLMISDDHHWKDYGFAGHPVVQTPRLDKLASESLLFTKGYVPSSLCCPSLASIITGQYPHQHRITSNDPPVPAGMNNRDFQKSQAFLDGRKIMADRMRQAPALPRLLAERGYLSLQTGKWWLGDFHTGGFTNGMTNGGRHGDDGLKIGRRTMQPIFDFLDTAQKEKKPFFIWYAPMLPHSPHDPPERLLDKYKDKTDSIHQARYWANIERFDETCGQLLDELDKRKLAENTIVVYVADNGWIQTPDNPRYAPKSKQSPYDGGLRTPLMIRYPGKIKPQKDDRHLVLSIDIAPTLLKIAGLKKADSQPGIDILDENALNNRKEIYGECFTHNFVDLDRPEKNLRFRWIREDAWKLIVPQPGEDIGVELYNIETDSEETKDSAAAEKERVNLLLQKLNTFYNPQ